MLFKRGPQGIGTTGSLSTKNVGLKLGIPLLALGLYLLMSGDGTEIPNLYPDRTTNALDGGKQLNLQQSFNILRNLLNQGNSEGVRLWLKHHIGVLSDDKVTREDILNKLLKIEIGANGEFSHLRAVNIAGKVISGPEFLSSLCRLLLSDDTIPLEYCRPQLTDHLIMALKIVMNQMPQRALLNMDAYLRNSK